MIRSLITSVCALLLVSTATAQFSCSLHSVDESGCDAAKAEDGSGCVWCSWSTYGVCVAEDQASQMKQILPVTCDDDSSGGDDDDDDDTTPPASDDDIPDGSVFACLQKENDGACGKASCVWCDTKGGFGVCLTEEAAAGFAKDSYWFDCDATEEEEDKQASNNNNDDIQDPLDTACLLAGLAGGNDEAVCVAAADSDGNACDFCTITDGVDLCLNAEQAQIASLVGGSCGATNDSAGAGASLMEVQDPYDTACLMAQLASGGNDESACESADDTDGYGCEWCSLSNGYNFCLTSEQASIAEVAGGVCKNGSNTEAGVGAVSLNEKKEDDVQDPADTACLLAGLSGGNDKSACVAAADSDGNACEFCSISNGLAFCLNAEQAQIAALVGGTCDSTNALVGANAAVAFKKSLRN